MEFFSRLWTPLLALQILVAQGAIAPAIAAELEGTAELDAPPQIPGQVLDQVSDEPSVADPVIIPEAEAEVDAAPDRRDEVTPETTPIEAATPAEEELELDLSDDLESEAPTDAETETDPATEDETDGVSETDERIFLIEEQISFIPPNGFTAMTAEEIRLKFPGTMPPQFAYANQPRNVSIGISLSDINLAPEQLPEVRQFLESFLEEAVPGFEWVSRDYETLGDARWIKLEFISQALDTQVHNDLYITSFNGKLLGFNFNSVLSLEEDLRPLLKRSRDSILLAPLETAKN